ncbi:DUF1753-domain-containing protein [Dendrothele bispora CBS 962.96]|uniref:DUF1753-domain-containing protein n=1 Tax=Dendrothele bispora (strain CBS 962.96) TaxID=1314807 RepID=A0A4S8LBS0_DENBC|nr:DUF1753-domain-containing protein [Dendrothele bispora CBS 962.96]
MKLMLRPEYRLWPLSSFLAFLDLKTGVTLALLFALLNKVAGVYGLIAVATGAGGSFAQLSLYIYSTLALVALVWGLKAVKDEDPKHTLYFAHLFFADHVFSTSWTVYFAVVWWFQTPHDGKRSANSPAQEQIIEGSHNSHPPLSDVERAAAAAKIWNHEKGMAAAIIILSWICKIYFILLIYSYASHLRKGSYRSLLRARPVTSVDPLDEDEEEIEDFYRIPLRTPNTGNSISSFQDFVNAPPRRTRHPQTSLNQSTLAKSNGKANGNASGSGHPGDEEEEVLFDEDEVSFASSSRGHSKIGTDESSTDEERTRTT